MCFNTIVMRLLIVVIIVVFYASLSTAFVKSSYFRGLVTSKEAVADNSSDITELVVRLELSLPFSPLILLLKTR